LGVSERAILAFKQGDLSEWNPHDLGTVGKGALRKKHTACQYARDLIQEILSNRNRTEPWDETPRAAIFARRGRQPVRVARQTRWKKFMGTG